MSLMCSKRFSMLASWLEPVKQNHGQYFGWR
jgi:hypothetical protein